MEQLPGAVAEECGGWNFSLVALLEIVFKIVWQLEVTKSYDVVVASHKSGVLTLLK